MFFKNMGANCPLNRRGRTTAAGALGAGVAIRRP
jgi:hypothetical protein